jgi:hypothetical protein
MSRDIWHEILINASPTELYHAMGGPSRYGANPNRKAA